MKFLHYFRKQFFLLFTKNNPISFHDLDNIAGDNKPIEKKYMQ